jgi:hypothetical protein
VVVSPHLRPRITHLPSWREDRRLVDLVKSAGGATSMAAERA